MKNELIILTAFVFLLTSCLHEKKNLPVVTTSQPTELTWDHAIAGGEVLDDGGSPIIARGICVTTSDTDLPEITDRWDMWHTTDSTGIGKFTSTTKLVWAGAIGTIAQTHYLRAYATNIIGTAYGELVTISPKSKPPSFPYIKLVSKTATSAVIDYETAVPPETFKIDEIDICASTTPNASISGLHFLVPLHQNPNRDTIYGLIPNTTYYLRGYIKNESGFAYSPEISFTTWEGSLSDSDGNVYPYITIGNQVWMTENINTTKFTDGTNIAIVQDNLVWGSSSTSAYCSYTGYGKLYNFYAIADTKKLCPSGWHIPSDGEWKTMEIYLGMTQNQADATGFRGNNEGGKLKYSGCPNYWTCQNIGATNTTGFNAVAAGYRYDNGLNTNSGSSAGFWTSTESDATNAWSRSINYDNAQISRISLNKKFGLSVRCLKD